MVSIPQFDGGWSYTQKEMTSLFNFIEYRDTYSILEFGGGSSTKKLYDHFSNHSTNLTYYVYETDPSYLPAIDDLKVVIYDPENIDTMDVVEHTFDLILVDGPNGDRRSKWFSKFRKCVKAGTIILVDDFNHFQCFSDELDKNFEYEVLDHHEEPFVAYGEHSWKIVKVIAPRND
jgi:hypothetical protein